MSSQVVKRALRALADPVKAQDALRFFKTGKGEYGEGDRFLGVRVPLIRQHVRKFQNITRKATLHLLKSPYHEERLCAVLILVQKFKRGATDEKNAIYTAYLQHSRYINNWDIVDCSAHYVVGAWLEDKNRQILFKLAASDCLWERRIAMIATYHFIRNHDFTDALELAAILKDDKEDLMHKAVGWMLREIGNRNLAAEERFLKLHYKTMPRTALRYAIEKFPEKKRQHYLCGRV